MSTPKAAVDEVIERAKRELYGTKCYCGRNKISGRSLCKPCYALLPAAAQRALYLPLREGYLPALDAAKRHLEAERGKGHAGA